LPPGARGAERLASLDIAVVFVPLSIFDLALVGAGQTPREALSASVKVAQLAEAKGYRRIWYAEHHNIPAIASSATSVVIAHVAAHTRTIRLGAGGIMLPNHSPLVIAEQFGTLEALHPGRIDLGLGRAPGTDRETLHALRRSGSSAEAFPQDVVELQAYLSGQSLIPGVEAVPGKGSQVPLYILGSSLFGASLAAALGLPYAFASHFAPDALYEAVSLYRTEFKPSSQLAAPHVIAGLNVIAADTDEEAQEHFRATLRFRVRALLAKGRALTDAEANLVLETPGGQQVRQMTKYSAIGRPADVRGQVERFAHDADADEVMTVHTAQSLEARLRSVELLASACGLEGPASSR
jgi:luciferase family oxidoreductase group 1